MGKEQELVEAARNGNYCQVEKLLSLRTKRVGPLASLRRGPGPNAQDASGYSALHHAALNGHKDVVELLLSHEASTNLVDCKGSTPLHLAAWTGKSDIVDVLLSRGPSIPDVNCMNRDNDTALHCAAQYGHTAVVTLLLEYSGDPTIKNMRDETPLDLAAQYGRLDTVDLLIRSHPELLLPYSKENCKHRAFGITPLHSASRNGHKNVVNLLLKSGFDVNAVTPVGTALHEATLCGKVEVAKILLEQGTDVNVADCQNRTVMTIAEELNTSVTREIRSLIKDKTILVDFGEDWSRSKVVPPTVGSPYDNVFFPPRPESSQPWDTVIEDYKRHRRHQSFEAGQLSKSLDMMESDDMSSSSGNDPSPRMIAAEAAAAKAVPSGGARSRVAGGRVRSRTVEVQLLPQRVNPGQGCTQTLSRMNRKSGNESGRTSSGDSGERWSMTPEGYLTIGGKSRPPKKPPRRAFAPPTTGGRHSRTLSFDTNVDRGHEIPCLSKLQHESAIIDTKLVKRRGLTSSYDNVLDSDEEQDVDDTATKRDDAGRNRSGSADNLLDSVVAGNHQGQKRRRKFVAEARIALEREKSPSSPTHYQQPPTPDHPPPPACQALTSIADRILPFTNGLASRNKRQSRDIETETDDVLVVVNKVDVGSSMTPTAEESSPVVQKPPSVEEFVGDGIFSGLFKGSVVPKSKEQLIIRPVTKVQSLSFNAADTEMAKKRLQVEEKPKNLETKDTAKPVDEKSLSLQMLSPFDEKEEWNKISELIASISSGLSQEEALIPSFVDREVCNRQVSMMSNGCELKDWLTKLGHEDLLAQFVSRGFDDLQFLGSGILEESDLTDMGVRDPRSRRTILEQVARLPCKLPKISPGEKYVVERFDSVEEWLSFLNLDFYVSKFHRYKFSNMNKVKKMWEVELTTILEITLPGHKKRILASIGPEKEDGRFSSLSSSTSSLAADRVPPGGRTGYQSDVSADLCKLSNEISEFQCEIREKLGFSSSGAAGKTGTLSRGKGRRKGRAPAPPSSAAGGGGGPGKSQSSDIDVKSWDPFKDPRVSCPVLERDPDDGGIFHEFPAQYIGSTIVHVMEGVETSRSSIQKLMDSADSKKRAKVTFRVSKKLVRFIDNHSKRVLCEHELQKISSASQLDADSRYFGYVTLDDPSGIHYCHVFSSDSAAIAMEVINALRGTFHPKIPAKPVLAISKANAPLLLVSAGTAVSPAVEMSRSVTSEASDSLMGTPKVGWPAERSLSTSDVQASSSSNGFVKRSTSSSSDNSPPTVCKLEKNKVPKKKEEEAVMVVVKRQTSTTSLDKPKIPAKPKFVPPPPKNAHLRAGSPMLQPSPLMLRKAQSTPQVDITSPNLKRAPLATSEDF